MRSNLALATGDRTAGACTTTTIQWHFEKSEGKADPSLRMPIQQIMTWLRLWKDNQHRKYTIIEHRTKTYCKLTTSPNKWLMVRGPMAATIATLIDVGVKPVNPISWLTANLTHSLNIHHDDYAKHRVKHELMKIIDNKTWVKAAEQ